MNRRPLQLLLVASIAFLAVFPATADVRLTIFVPGVGGDPALQDAVAVLVEQTGGDVLFKGDDSRLLVVRAQEESIGVLAALPVGIHADHACIGWAEPCSSLPIMADMEATPQSRQELLDVVESVGGTVHSETLLLDGDSYFSLSVPADALTLIDAIEGVHNWQMRINPQLGGTRLQLGEGHRFTVFAEWETNTSAGFGLARYLTRDTGAFYFFRPDNLELTVKVLDGCSVNGHYWVFIAGLTNVGVKIQVISPYGSTDYESPLGTTFETVTDTTAIPCP